MQSQEKAMQSNIKYGCVTTLVITILTAQNAFLQIKCTLILSNVVLIVQVVYL